MSILDRCRSNLRALESSLREEHKPEFVLRLDFSDIFPASDKKPTPLEELELLNTFATYFPCNDDSKARLFYEIFPFERDVPDDRVRFLVKLSSLALCIGLPVILELAAVWLKVRVAHLYASTAPPAPLYQPVVFFVTGITSDMLSIPGLPCTSHSVGGYLTDGDSLEHPLLNLHHTSPLFAEAYLSAATLVYGTSPTFICALNPTHPLYPTGPPPSPIIQCFIHWLQTSHVQPKSHHHSTANHAVTWLSVDWLFVIRRFKHCFQTHAYADQVFACCPPTPICLAWWTIFVPLDCVSMSSSGKLDPQTKEYKSLNAALGELHYELLLCSVDNTSSPSTSSGHRHGSGSNPINTSSGSSAGYTTFANWSLSCFRKQQPTKDYHYLELFVQHVSKRCLKPIDTKVSSCPTSELHLKQSCLDIKEDLAITRTIEFLQLAWISGRLRNLGTDDFTRLLSPLVEHKLIHLFLTRLKR